MRYFIFICSLLFIAILCSAIPVDEEKSVKGKLILELSHKNGQLRITDSHIVLGAGPMMTGQGFDSIALYNINGTRLMEGNIRFQNYLVHEYVDENGDFQGKKEPLETTMSLILPYYEEADSLVIRQDQNQDISLNLEDAIHVAEDTSAPSAIQTGNRQPQFGAYFKELQGRATPLSPATEDRDIAPSKKISVDGKIIVTKVKDYSLLKAEVVFHPHNRAKKSIKVKSKDGRSIQAKLPAGTYTVVGKCNYADPATDGEIIPLYPDPLVITSYDPEKDKLTLKWKLNKLRKGQLVDASGKSVAGSVVIMRDSANPVTNETYYYAVVTTNAEGVFYTRLPKKKIVMIALPNSGEPAGEKLTVVDVKKIGNSFKIECPSQKEISGTALKKIWNSGKESKKLNLIFLAESFTDRKEPFTDLNGNGHWDGDLLMDENDNGQLDGNEFYFDRNADGKYDPAEPFTDENGDSICNRYERAKFEADSAMAAAAVLNFPPFDEFADRINVYTYWIPSTHGVHSLVSYQQWSNMDTEFGVESIGRGPFLPTNVSSSAAAVANRALPKAKAVVPIVMTHDPFKAVRANAMFNFGRVLLSAEDHRAGAVLIHELGHSVGGLDDEYLFAGANSSGPFSEPGAPNLTKETDPALAKWSKYIEGKPRVPTPDNKVGYGLYEGAKSYRTGIYRPTFSSMMRSTRYPYYSVNAEKLREVLSKFK